MAILMASPEQLAMQEVLTELQFPRRRRMSAAHVMHSGALERIASGRRVEAGWGCGARPLDGC
jgi:hypothetical protein